VAAVALRARRGPPTVADGLLGFGPTLVILGIILGEEALLGYGLIATGVMLAVAASVLRQAAARR